MVGDRLQLRTSQGRGLKGRFASGRGNPKFNKGDVIKTISDDKLIAVVLAIIGLAFIFASKMLLDLLTMPDTDPPIENTPLPVWRVFICSLIPILIGMVFITFAVSQILRAINPNP